MYSLDELKTVLGEDCKFHASKTAEEIKNLIKNKDFSQAGDVPFVLEVGNLDIEVNIYSEEDKIWLGYYCCLRTDGVWESYDDVFDDVNLNVPDIEAEMFRVLDKFADERGLSYFTQNSEYNGEQHNNLNDLER